MHTARQLADSRFLVAHRGAPSSHEELLPDWAPHDRLEGIVVTAPFGAVAASHLVQLTVTASYDVLPNRRAGHMGGIHTEAVYPEI